MRHLLKVLLVLLTIGSAASVMAREIEDGNLLVYPTKDGKYKVGDITGDKVTFYGYVGDKYDTKHITGILLKKGDQATAEQKHIIYVTARQLKIGAFIDLDGKIQPIVEADPAPAPAAQPAPAVQPAPATAPAAAATPVPDAPIQH